MADGVHPVIINNTNIHRSEMKPYVEMGKEYGYAIEIKCTRDTWRVPVEELHRRVKGKVPLSVIKNMKWNFEYARNAADVLNDNTDWTRK